MKSLFKNPWFYVALVAAIFITVIVARSETADKLATDVKAKVAGTPKDAPIKDAPNPTLMALSQKAV